MSAGQECGLTSPSTRTPKAVPQLRRAALWAPVTSDVRPQMKRSLAIASVAAAVVLAGLASYRLGLRAGAAQAKESFGPVLASVQADLGLSKLQRLRVLEADLARGCLKEALAKLRFDIDSQLYVLSSLYRDHRDTWVIAELAKRDPTIPAQLESFKSEFGNSWTEPKCAA